MFEKRSEKNVVKKWWQNQAEAMAEARSSGKGLKEGGGSVREQALALGGLRKVNIVHEGWLDWWSARDTSQTAGIDQWNMENVQLGNATFAKVKLADDNGATYLLRSGTALGKQDQSHHFVPSSKQGRYYRH